MYNIHSFYELKVSLVVKSHLRSLLAWLLHRYIFLAILVVPDLRALVNASHFDVVAQASSLTADLFNMLSTVL